MKKVAVVLCGSGFKDGSEIRESVATLWAISKQGSSSQCYAPEGFAYDVINCLTGEPLAEKREMRVEAARIARGEVRALAELEVKNYDALILPGGFGVAKNLCTFALEGARGKVHPVLKEKLHAFHEAGKPIGAICIAPAVVALAFPGGQFELTVGETSEASAEIEKLGHRHVICKVNEVHGDLKNRIFTTPAYMYGDAKIHEVFQGIEELVKRVC